MKWIKAKDNLPGFDDGCNSDFVLVYSQHEDLFSVGRFLDDKWNICPEGNQGYFSCAFAQTMDPEKITHWCYVEMPYDKELEDLK